MRKAFTFLILVFMTQSQIKAQKITYPPTRKGNVNDNYFGTRVEDPYRWLEDDTASEVKDWVVAQNSVTRSYLDGIPYRNDIKKKLENIWNYPKYSAPFKEGDYYFFYKNDGLQNQSILYIQKGKDGEPKVFIDPNKLSTDGTVALAGITFSKDHKYAAFSTAKAGSDWNKIQVMEVESGKILKDEINWVKFSSAVWKGNGFYYSRYDEPAKGKEYANKNEFHKVFYHKLGTSQEKDPLIFEDKNHPLRYFSAQVSEDEKFLFIYGSQGTQGNEVYFMESGKEKSGFKLLFKGFEYNYRVIDNEGGFLLATTDNGSPNYRLVKVDPKNPEKENWVDVIPEKNELLDEVTKSGGKLFAHYLKDASTRIYQYSRGGIQEREIKLPAIGTATGFSGKKDDMDVFYTFNSFTFPPAIYSYNVASGESSVFRKSEFRMNLDEFETRQVFYPSKDGSMIPMFLVHKKGLKMDGNNPVYLYGYGGFNVNLTPSFSISRLIFLEQGGIFALANLRGGGEYGESWHRGGMLENKQNVFDDFISAAEFLIDNKYTSPSKIAIAGGSNGGLLVGACMTQRPDLFKVALPAVGVLDMLRYQKFTIGWGWVVEYGSSDNPDQFKYLHKYSPLHNLKPGVKYPATLITTGDHDDRVVPAHSFKFIARLQEVQSGANPVFIRIETKAGHGAGKPTSKLIEEAADTWAFIFHNLGVDYKYQVDKTK